MTEPKMMKYALPPLYVLAAPLLVLLLAITLAVAAVSRALFGFDPAPWLREEDSLVWAAAIKLTEAVAFLLLFTGPLLAPVV